jgi:hypothetical protein
MQADLDQGRVYRIASVERAVSRGVQGKCDLDAISKSGRVLPPAGAESLCRRMALEYSALIDAGKTGKSYLL